MFDTAVKTAQQVLSKASLELLQVSTTERCTEVTMHEGFTYGRV